MSTYKLIYDLNHCSVDVEMYVWCFLGKIVQVLKRKLCDCEWVYVLVSVYFSTSKKRIKNNGLQELHWDLWYFDLLQRSPQAFFNHKNDIVTTKDGPKAAWTQTM